MVCRNISSCRLSCKPTENYSQHCSATFLAFFSSLCFFVSARFLSHIVSVNLSDKSTVHYLPVTSSQQQLVKKEEHVAAKESDISLRRWWRPNNEQILDLHSSGDACPTPPGWWWWWWCHSGCLNGRSGSVYLKVGEFSRCRPERLKTIKLNRKTIHEWDVSFTCSCKVSHCPWRRVQPLNVEHKWSSCSTFRISPIISTG